MSGIYLFVRRASFVGVLLSCLFTPVFAMADSTRIYRCETENGRVEFRQMPCRTGDQEILDVEDVRVGWDAPVPKVGTSLKKSVKKPKPAKTKKASAQSCFKKRQRLESVNRTLRRGYKAGQGVELRHRRRQYEDYLSHFCDT